MKSLVLFLGIVAASALSDPPIKRFELNLTWATGAPDGYERQHILVNDQFPGPPLLIDEGDNVEVTVNNFLPMDTAMHYHGIE